MHDDWGKELTIGSRVAYRKQTLIGSVIRMRSVEGRFGKVFGEVKLRVEVSYYPDELDSISSWIRAYNVAVIGHERSSHE